MLQQIELLGHTSETDENGMRMQQHYKVAVIYAEINFLTN